MKKFMLVWLVFLSGCGIFGSQNDSASHQVTENPDGARLRLFGQAASKISFYKNSACVGGDSETVSGGFGQQLGSIFKVPKIQRIGMPDTLNTLNLSQRNGIISKAYFREYEVAPGEPLTITMSYYETTGPSDRRTMMGGVSRSCDVIAVTFTPERGKDYEGSLDFSSDTCRLTLNEIKTMPSSVELIPASTKRATACE